jgi:4-amino-4-deoxy-L-arabinose transferase-like glycosyltransferase
MGPAAPAAHGVSRLIAALALWIALQALFSVPRLSWELVASGGGGGSVGIVLGFAAASLAAGLVWRGRNHGRRLLARIAGRLERIPRGVWIGGMLLLGLALRILWVRIFTAPQASDGQTYTELAAQLTRGEAYRTPGSGTWAEWPPGYPLLLAATFLITGINTGSIVLLNLVLFAGTLMSTDALARRLAGEGQARLAALLVAAWPNLVTTAGIAAKEMLVLFLVTTALTLWLDAGAAPSAGAAAGPWLAAGFALGLASLTQPAMLLFPGVLVAHDLLTGPRFLLPGGRALVSWVLLLVGVLAPIAPWALRNQHIFHRPVLVSSNGGSVFYRANNPLATGGWTERGEKDLDHMTELEASDNGYRWGREWIRDHPGRFLALALHKQVLFLGGDAIGIYETLKRGLGLAGTLYMVLKGIANTWWWLLWLLILLTLATWRAPAALPPGALLLLLAVLYFWLLDSVFESGTRHHVPLAGVLAVLAVLGARAVVAEGRRETPEDDTIPPA